MTLMFLLAPSTRFGYFIYPGTLVLWLFAVLPAQRDAVAATADDKAAQPAGERTPHRASEKPS
jgi:hypothetical protein